MLSFYSKLCSMKSNFGNGTNTISIFMDVFNLLADRIGLLWTQQIRNSPDMLIAKANKHFNLRQS